VLVLTRNLNESIIINDNITITMLGAKGQQVKLGIDAPREISVNREEIQERINAEKLHNKT